MRVRTYDRPDKCKCNPSPECTRPPWMEWDLTIAVDKDDQCLRWIVDVVLFPLLFISLISSVKGLAFFCCIVIHEQRSEEYGGTGVSRLSDSSVRRWILIRVCASSSYRCDDPINVSSVECSVYLSSTEICSPAIATSCDLFAWSNRTLKGRKPRPCGSKVARAGIVQLLCEKIGGKKSEIV